MPRPPKYMAHCYSLMAESCKAELLTHSDWTELSLNKTYNSSDVDWREYCWQAPLARGWHMAGPSESSDE